MNANEMIDRYVNEVGEHLPRKTRADIELELRSLLLDTLDEQCEGEPTPKIAAELLREFGHPEEIATQYSSEEYLIGPRLFPTYKLVITITLAIVGGLHLLGLGLSLWQSSGEAFVNSVLNSLLSFGQSAIMNAGIVTLIFALIEQFAGDELGASEKKAKTWDPYQLPAIKDPNRIDRGELVVGIIFSVAFIFWLNFFPDWFGGVQIDSTDSGIFALFTEEFLQLIPWFTASLLLDVVLKTAVLIQGRWNRGTRSLELVSLGFGLYVSYLVFSLEEISTVPFFTTIGKSILAIVILVTIIEMAVKLFRLLGNGDKVDHLVKRMSKLA